MALGLRYFHSRPFVGAIPERDIGSIFVLLIGVC